MCLQGREVGQNDAKKVNTSSMVFDITHKKPQRAKGQFFWPSQQAIVTSVVAIGNFVVEICSLVQSFVCFW